MINEIKEKKLHYLVIFNMKEILYSFVLFLKNEKKYWIE